jgi:hypothetical protein
MSNVYDAETIQLLRKVLEEAWDALQPHHRGQTSKAHLAECVLRHAAKGERHPGRLRFQAIADALPNIVAA